MIGSFIKPEDVATYLEAYSNGSSLEDESINKRESKRI